MKYTLSKLVFFTSIIILSNTVCSDEFVNAQVQNSSTFVTNWKVVNKSLTDLLNSGWRIVSQSAYRVATATSGGFGAIDEEVFTYTIVKDEKFITCLIVNPKREPAITRSGCRLLN